VRTNEYAPAWLGGDVTDHKLSWTSDGRVRKQYRPNAGDLPEREWRALVLLHEYAPGLAPAPITADLAADPPSIVMSALPGKPLGGQPLSSSDLGAIATALDRLHTCVPAQVLRDVPTCFGPLPDAVANMRNQLTGQPRPDSDPVVTRAYDESVQWLTATEANQLNESERAVLGRADHNLTNFLRDGDRALLVDFEYAGRSDRCAEIAELLEHISARCTPDAVWQRFLDGLDLSKAERQRVRTIRRLNATMWLFLLLPGQAGEHRNPPGTLRKQAQRTLDLLGS
jgi:hypothetical protein